MVRFAAALLRGVIATFAGLLIAGGTLTLAADRSAVDRPTLVPVAPGPAMLTVPDVTGQAYVFAKGILQDHGFAWHVTGPVLGYAANTVSLQRPVPGTIVLDSGAPTITLVLARNSTYVEKGTPENDAPYAGTAIRLPALRDTRPKTSGAPRIEPVPIPVLPTSTLRLPTQKTTHGSPSTAPAATTASATPAPVPARSASGRPRTPDFTVAGAPEEPAGAKTLPDRVAALSTFVETHRDKSSTNLSHWLYEHAYVVAGARFGWWHGAEALQALVGVDKRAESLWGVGGQARTTAEQALAEVRARGG